MTNPIVNEMDHREEHQEEEALGALLGAEAPEEYREGINLVVHKDHASRLEVHDNRDGPADHGVPVRDRIQDRQEEVEVADLGGRVIRVTLVVGVDRADHPSDLFRPFDRHDM